MPALCRRNRLGLRGNCHEEGPWDELSYKLAGEADETPWPGFCPCPATQTRSLDGQQGAQPSAEPLEREGRSPSPGSEVPVRGGLRPHANHPDDELCMPPPSANLGMLKSRSGSTSDLRPVIWAVLGGLGAARPSWRLGWTAVRLSPWPSGAPGAGLLSHPPSSRMSLLPVRRV